MAGPSSLQLHLQSVFPLHAGPAWPSVPNLTWLTHGMACLLRPSVQSLLPVPVRVHSLLFLSSPNIKNPAPVSN